MAISVDAATKILVLNPERGRTTYEDKNDSSVVFLLKYCNSEFLFTGDSGSDEEEKIFSRYPNLHADVLKVGHHGSARSTSDLWLHKLSPKVAVVSVGRKNWFNLPSPVTIKRLKQAGCRIYRTDQNGTIRISTDGRTLHIVTTR